MEAIITKSAPEPAGHYSQAIVHNGVIYVSGQLPIVPETGEKVFGTIEEQTVRILQNIEGILRASGGSRNSVIKTTVYITDIEEWGTVNAVYGSFFGSHKPANVH